MAGVLERQWEREWVARLVDYLALTDSKRAVCWVESKEHEKEHRVAARTASGKAA